MPKFDLTADEAIAEARTRLPLNALILRLTSASIGKRSDCPLCTAKKKFGIYSRGGRQYYKCFSTSCAANNSGDEVDFIMLCMNLDRKAAFKEYLKLAGVTPS